MNGSTYIPALDHQRLARQEAKVHAVMADGEWRTLREISARTGAPEASVSARLRGLRPYGLTIERRRVGDPSCGVLEYRVLSPAPVQVAGCMVHDTDMDQAAEALAKLEAIK